MPCILCLSFSVSVSVSVTLVSHVHSMLPEIVCCYCRGNVPAVGFARESRNGASTTGAREGHWVWLLIGVRGMALPYGVMPFLAICMS